MQNFLKKQTPCSLGWKSQSQNTVEVQSVGTFPLILVKLANPTFPPQKSSILNKMDGNESFLATTLLGGIGGQRDEPKADQKIVIRSLMSPT